MALYKLDNYHVCNGQEAAGYRAELCLAEDTPGADGGIYSVAHPIEQMSHHLTMLAYDMNGGPVSYGHGRRCGRVMNCSTASGM